MPKEALLEPANGGPIYATECIVAGNFWHDGISTNVC